MKLKPLNDYVLVRREKAKETTDSGLLIVVPEDKRKATTGEVLAVGPGACLENGTRRAIDLVPGQVVYFKMYSGQEIRIDGEDLLMLREQEIEAIVER